MGDSEEGGERRGPDAVALLARALEFLAQEVDASDRAELQSLVEGAESGDAGPLDELRARFSGRPGFGTAGIRGIVGAGESRMNRALVRRVTHGLVKHLVAEVPDAAKRGIVIGRDARRLSDVLQKETAFVCAAMGVRVHWIDGPQPTPLVAFAVRHLGAAAGVVITASHNPPEYNGYKVYWGNGAQIVPSVEAAISEEIDRSPGAKRVPYRASEHSHAVAIQGAYMDALERLRFLPELDVSPLRVAYTALHGVGQRLFVAAMIRRGFRSLFPVAAQAEPDASFPTLRLPNPEQPGALDLVLAEAEKNDCDLVLAHDPDADRLGAAVRRAKGNYVVLNGNEIGALLASHVLGHTRAKAPLVVSTVVSSRLVQKIAEARGARYADALTGFKWIANEAMRIERAEKRQLVLGCEEALGYTVGSVVRDKDGIGAGLTLAEMAVALKLRGETLLDELARLRERHGHFVSRQRSVTLEGSAGAKEIDEAMRRLRREPLWRIGAEDVAAIWDLADGAYRLRDGSHETRDRLRGNVLVYDLDDGGRIAVRPSGTEPKLKLYLEVVETKGGSRTAVERLHVAEADLLRVTGLDG